MSWQTLVTSRHGFYYVKNKNQQVTGKDDTARDTGWHLIPNQLFIHTMSYHELERLYTIAHQIKAVKQIVTIGHAVPLTSIASIIPSQTGEIVAFNNTLPLWIYQDKPLYTRFQINSNITTNPEGDTETTVITLPTFTDIKNSERFMQWDPLHEMEQVDVLYPGNTGCTIEWNIHNEDYDKYWDLNTTQQEWSKTTATTLARTIYDKDYITPYPKTPGATIPQTIYLNKQQLHSNNPCIIHPINNILMKMEPIHSPATLKNLLHWAKVMISVKTTFEFKPRYFNIPTELALKQEFKPNNDNTCTLTHITSGVPKPNNVANVTLTPTLASDCDSLASVTSDLTMPTSPLARNQMTYAEPSQYFKGTETTIQYDINNDGTIQPKRPKQTTTNVIQH